MCADILALPSLVLKITSSWYFKLAFLVPEVHEIEELFRDRSMLHQMEQGFAFTYTQKVNACKQLAAGIMHLHKKGVIVKTSCNSKS